MNKKLKQIYYSEELPKLISSYRFLNQNRQIPSGLCALLQPYLVLYYKGWWETKLSIGQYLGGIRQKGKWNNERLNLICLLIHSLELED